MSRIIKVAFEIVFFLFFIILINYFFFPDFPGFIGINPHPYWLGILLFALRYGVFAGFISGMLSAILYLSGAWVFLERYVFEDLSFYYLPFFFILIGVLTGEGIRRFKQTIAQLKEDKSHLMNNIQLLEDEIKTLKKINNEMERKVVTQMSTLTTLYEGARRLETMEIDDLYRAILAFFCKTMEIEEASIYVKEEGGWRLQDNYGWKSYHKRPEKIGLNEGLIGLAGTKNKVISIRDFAKKQHLKNMPKLIGDSIFAGPLKNGEHGDVVAVFCAQKIPFLRFSSSTMIVFSFLLSWASRAIQKAHFIRNLQLEAIHDLQFNVYTRKYFTSRAKEEFAIAQSYDVPIHAALVKVQGLESMSELRQDMVLTTISEILNNSARDLDVVARYQNGQIYFAMLLIALSPDQAETIKTNIINTFSKTEFQDKKAKQAVRLQIELVQISSKHKSFEDVLKGIQSKLDHGTRSANPSNI